MKYLKPFVLLRQTSLGLSLALISLAAVQAEEAVNPGKLAINKNGIKVWTYQTPNNPAFNYRATTVLNTSLTSAAAVILDTDSLIRWVPYVSAVDLIERNPDNGTFVLRMQLNFPFPLQKRDIVVRGKISQTSDGTVTIKNQAISDRRAPLRQNVVRLTHYEGDWTLKPLAANKVEVTTSGYADPGGAIPLSIANHFVQQQPYQMLGSMKNYVKNARYQQAQLEFIRDPYAK
ncbi:START domain-containing protein [Alkanindiges sp. WGS2144]|uniref:START domain-containing protein n=1 Tax=Alkanindiges sp. WGS2144 TaxID=3366808 RepID=UPI003752E9F4